MAAFTQSDDLQGATFTDVNLRGARFVRSDLSGAVIRAVDAAGADIDAPWLLEAGNTLLINGVDVVPFVEAELNRRCPPPQLAGRPRFDGKVDSLAFGSVEWYQISRFSCASESQRIQSASDPGH